MKKLLLSAAVVLVAAGARAQNFEWGARAGTNIAWATDAASLPYVHGDNIGMTARTGLYAGVSAEMIADEFFGVQGELLYSQMGTEVNRHRSKTDYIALPVMAKCYPFGVSRGFSINFGPQVGYMLSAREGVDGNFHKQDGLRKFDAGALIGLSCKLERHFEVSARYCLGLTKLYKNDYRNMNRAVSLGLGYRF